MAESTQAIYDPQPMHDQWGKEYQEEARKAAGISEVRVTDATTGGQKGQKAEAWNLLPWDELADVARLYSFGATKYAANNWKLGYKWGLSYAALIRHLVKFWANKESYDEETKCHHLSSVIFHCLALMYYEKNHPTLDDRG